MEMLEQLQQRDEYHAIKVVGDTEGGKALIDYLVGQIMGTIHRLANSDADPLCAHLQANMNLLRVLLKAEDNEKMLDEVLEEALRD